MKINVDLDEVMDAIESDEMVGFCIDCGYIQHGCEPDARRYECEDCGKNTVYGAQELLFMMA